MSGYNPHGFASKTQPSHISVPPPASVANSNHVPPVGVGQEPVVDQAVERITRHKDYYLSSGDVHFLVENYLFRVHRYFFERESVFFREKLSLSTISGLPVGGSLDTPIHLEDVQADDFARFLWIFYNPKYSIYEASADDWAAILKLSFDWRFSEIKILCCRELERFTIDPIKKIDMYQRYDVDRRLLIPSYGALTTRAQSLSLAEGRQLGLETALLLAEAREAARNINGPSANINQDRVNEIIVKIFNLNGPPPSLEPVKEPHNFGPGQPSRQVPVVSQPQPQATDGHQKKGSHALSRSSSPPPSSANGHAPQAPPHPQTQPHPQAQPHPPANAPANSSSEPHHVVAKPEQPTTEAAGVNSPASATNKADPKLDHVRSPSTNSSAGASGVGGIMSRMAGAVSAVLGDADPTEGEGTETRPVSPGTTRRGQTKSNRGGGNSNRGR